MEKLTSDERQVLAELNRATAYASFQLGQACGMTRPETSKILQRLKRRGYAEVDLYLWRSTSAGRAVLQGEGNG